MKKILFSVAFLALSMYASAQTLSIQSDSLLWAADEFYNGGNQETVSHNSEFKTNASSITWVQDKMLYTFVITSLSGSWLDANQDGEVVFNVTWKTRSGTLHFKRQSGQYTITMEFLKNGQNIMPYTFPITQVSKL